MRIFAAIYLLILLSACTNVKTLNIKRSEIGMLSNYDVSTFSDYGNDVFYDPEVKLHRYDIYVGGYGGCGGHLLIYAKPKMDRYLINNGYSDYTVMDVHHQLSPPSKCKLFIKYNN
ncbi:hypothetical protein [Bowmanella dokdonensis]|uniref:Lipoprotein n=1 Tax=Bowmanella dokdonensis TaxID=751969 RepID=A0A939IL15_9ALTE|nr:hypothetical protein [Bowmanella dokdonensis]MBN7823738.1 hypothetical protein [Bowmanella dokdonensis]